MRTTIIRSATFATIVIFPLFSSPSGSEEGALPWGTSVASADGTINRLFRWTGYGWSCGYHACNNNGWGLRDGLPPVGNTANRHPSAVPARFELVDPGHAAVYPAGHVFTGHHHQSFVAQEYVNTTTPFTHGQFEHAGGSIVTPQPSNVEPMLQPYRSAIPPKSPEKPRKPAIDSEDGTASPSDLEKLPLPKGERDKKSVPDQQGERDELDDLLLEDDSAQWAPSRNRSARRPSGSVVR